MSASVHISDYGGAIRIVCRDCHIDEPRDRYSTTFIEVRQHNREHHPQPAHE